MRISAVIPTWCEESRVGPAVHAAFRFADEVLVVDAGSPDGTAEVATRAGATVLQCPEKGRGPQLDYGAGRATGDVLVFLHADTTVAHGAREPIERALADPEVVGGNFYLKFVPCGLWGRVFTLANDVRRRAFGIYYGDSAIFVRREVWREVGGFRAQPIFEDYDFVRRLERMGRTAYVTDVIARTSARRFQHAPLRTLGIWTLLQTLYSAGVPPRRLARWYADVR